MPSILTSLTELLNALRDLILSLLSALYSLILGLRDVILSFLSNLISAVDAGQPHDTSTAVINETKPPSPQGTLVPIKSPPLFALLIAINDYPNIPVLRGAVADLRAVQAFVEDVLRVPPAQIRTLCDMEATRAAIVRALLDLRKDTRIQKGDPILIFFAGHGATADAPSGWIAGDKKIQLIVPYDYKETVDGQPVEAIPDRTVGALLQHLADVKGNNITVIFDCCHSGSGTRTPTDGAEPTRLVRGIENTVEAPPPGLDRDIWFTSSEERAAEIPAGFLHAGLRSHVLFAACGANESALEERGRGTFTTALLETLRVAGADRVTYTELLQRIPDLPKQSPQCEGANKENIVFNARAPSQGRFAYPVRKEGRYLVVQAGEAQGVTENAEFAVYAGSRWDTRTSERPLGTFPAGTILPFSTILETKADAFAEIGIHEQAFALQTRAGVDQDLRLHVASGELRALFASVAQEIKDHDPAQRGIRLVEDHAELRVSLENDLVVFDFLDSRATVYGFQRMPFRRNPNPDDIYPVMRAAAHFFWHLRHSPKRGVLRSKVKMEFVEVKADMDDLTEDLFPIVKPVSDNLIRGNVIDLVVDPASLYGTKITSLIDAPVYASLFYFDCSSFKIDCQSQNNSARGGKIDPSLPPLGEFSIGYGGGGAPPYKYTLGEGQDIDVGFLKLYLSTEPVDLSGVTQASPFDGVGRGPEDARTRPQEVWDTILIPVVQRRSPPS